MTITSKKETKSKHRNLKEIIDNLSSSLYTPLGSLNQKRDRLNKVSHDREVIGIWRDLRDYVISQGVPYIHNLSLLIDKKQEFYYLSTKSQTNIIYVPTRHTSLLKNKQIDLSNKSYPWSNLLVLLHEMGHAYLHSSNNLEWRDRYTH